MKQNKLQPRHVREHYSFSQYNVFLTQGWREYCKRYVYGDNVTNPAMQLGRQVAEMIEKDMIQEEEVLEHLRVWLPHYDFNEFKIEQMFCEIPLIGFLDGIKVIPCPDCGKTYPLK